MGRAFEDGKLTLGDLSGDGDESAAAPVLTGPHATVTQALTAWAAGHPEDEARAVAIIVGIRGGRLWTTERPAPRGFDFTADAGPAHALVVRALAAATQDAPFLSPEWSEYRHKLDKFQAGALTLEPVEAHR